MEYSSEAENWYTVQNASVPEPLGVSNNCNKYRRNEGAWRFLSIMNIYDHIEEQFSLRA